MREERAQDGSRQRDNGLGGWCLSRGGPRLGAGLRENDQVTMGRADRQGDLFDDVVRFCEGSLPTNSIYGFLARERDRLFPAQTGR